jgi:DNA polymerase-3 subunit alpha
MLDGLGSVKNMVQAAVNVGQKHLAITDHGNMIGAVEFHRECLKQNIKPVIGCELYMSRIGTTILDRDASNRKPRHLLALAANRHGYKNLMRLVTEAELRGFYYKPRVDYDLIEKYNAGIVTTTGCMAADIPQMILNGADSNFLRKSMSWWVDVFGRDRFFVELQHHPGIPELPEMNLKLMALARYFDLKCLITNDSHYPTKDSAIPHDVLLCVQTKSFVTDKDRMHFTDDEYYIKSEEEIRRDWEQYSGFQESWMTNTVELAEECFFDIEEHEEHLPSIEISSKYSDSDKALSDMTWTAAKERYGQAGLTQEIVDRITEELTVIQETGYADYYLILKDLLDYAATENIIYNCRGSGAGSIVSYLLGLSHVDPLEHHLLFERFINKVRVTMPDFDIDFPDYSRKQIVDYLIDKYGYDRVAQVNTVGRMKARMSVRDVARALGMPAEEADVLAKKILNVPGKDITIENSLAKDGEWYSPELLEAYNTDDKARQVLDLARVLDKTARHTGVHAAAVMIGDKDLVEYTPLQRGTKTSHTDHIAQYEYKILESLGLLKIDVLGLSTLTVVQECLKIINDDNIAYESINIHDDTIYELLSTGEVDGVFQVESTGMKRILMRLKPYTFSQIMDVISLYRPGPLQYIDTYIARSHGEEQVTYPHELLKGILEETQGIIIYQEQVMKALEILGGFSLAEADIVRKGMGKKKPEIIKKARKQFVDGCMSNHRINEDKANQIFDDIQQFAGYGFNRSHAASYARITAITAWLKANYPVEYMTALLRAEHSKKEKVMAYTMETRRMGIPILPPTVGDSKESFSIVNADIIESVSRYKYPLDGRGIIFGYDSIGFLNQDIIDAMVATECDSLDDITNIPFELLNKRSFVNLVAAGVFDNIASRRALISGAEELLAIGKAYRDSFNLGQMSIVKPRITIKDTDFVTDKELSELEKEAMGTWVNYHPIDISPQDILDLTTCDIGDLVLDEDIEEAVVLGILTSFSSFPDKNGNMMVIGELASTSGLIKCLIFNKTYQECREYLVEGGFYLVSGRVTRKKEEPAIIVDSIVNRITRSNKMYPSEIAISGEENEVLGFLHGIKQGTFITKVHLFDQNGAFVRKIDIQGGFDKKVLTNSKYRVKVRND